MTDINIDGRLIGLSYPPVVIVEIGINHGGSLKVAFEMVDAAMARHHLLPACLSHT